MAASIFDRIQAKIELFRLEKRYTRRRERRTTFRSNAIYVDGEYIYQTPNSTGSSAQTSTSTPGINALHCAAPTAPTPRPSKRLSRMSMTFRPGA